MSLILSKLTDLCTLTPKSVSKSSTTATPITSAGTAVTNVPCAIQAMSSRESERYGRQETGETQLWGYFLPDVTIGTDYWVTPSTGTYAGVRLSVVGPKIDRAGTQDHIKVPLSVVEGGPDQ